MKFHPVRVARDAAEAHVAGLEKELGYLINPGNLSKDLLQKLEIASKNVFDARRDDDDDRRQVNRHDQAEQDMLADLLIMDIRAEIAIRVLVVLRELNNAKHTLYYANLELTFFENQIEYASKAARKRRMKVRNLNPGFDAPTTTYNLVHRFAGKPEDKEEP